MPILSTTVIKECTAADSPVAGQPSSVCTRKNTFLVVDGSCDSYVECIEFVPVHKTCPDGLHYDPSVKWPGYPCGYPADVPCKGRGAAQAAEPTKDCPHQFGFFASTAASPNDCGRYRMCVAGHAVEMSCPTGLAFNPILSRCDWPFNVPSCNVDAFLAYKCPAASIDASGNAIVTNHKYEGNCYAFYSCEAGESRLLSCDAGLAFDPTTGYCVDEDRVDCGVKAVPQQSASAALVAPIQI
ncbi:protein obstructor-E-like [Leptidea sinapis]|uniref:protein obstructor-E-like n=1 Tax=Leptidea sinapis TaxID=189913 RepID=UPI0021C3F4C9|nr:protein obstructor-E-like [Leptidea sinapis]